MLEYKVVELSTVTDDSLEEVINKKVRGGWHLDGINFAMSQSSKRPQMAFVLFTKDGPVTEGEPDDEQDKPK